MSDSHVVVWFAVETCVAIRVKDHISNEYAMSQFLDIFIFWLQNISDKVLNLCAHKSHWAEKLKQNNHHPQGKFHAWALSQRKNFLPKNNFINEI